jgi:hypothetical protein
MKNLLFVFILCGTFSLTISAEKKTSVQSKNYITTNILIGKVISTELGISFASITYFSGGRSYSRLTDEDGNFTLYNIDAASGITASAQGYVTQHVTLKTAGGGIVIMMKKI